jgi:hypothetical protein
MKIAVELNEAESQHLADIAASLGIPVEELASVAVSDFIDASAADFGKAADRVLDKNKELYRRLS